MNSARLNGEILSGTEKHPTIRYTTNAKKQCPQVDFLLSAPFKHPVKELSPDYRAFLRVYVFGEDAEWINDNLYEGAHVEIRKGFIQTWYMAAQKKTFYRVVGIEIDRLGCFQAPPYNEEWNRGRFSGFFRNQFSSGEYNGVKTVGISIKALPDMKFYGTSYATYLSAMLYGEEAEKVDGNVWKGRTLDLLEGQLQPFHNDNGTYGLYIIGDKIEF
jgi:hypothetical protein